MAEQAGRMPLLGGRRSRRSPVEPLGFGDELPCGSNPRLWFDLTPKNMLDQVTTSAEPAQGLELELELW